TTCDVPPLAREIMSGGRKQPLALRSGNAPGGAAEFFRSPRANFDKHRRGPESCDQIDFAESAAVIALEDRESPLLEKSGGASLGAVTSRHGPRPRSSACPPGTALR